MIPGVIRTITIILACTACGGLLRLYVLRRAGAMPMSASLSVVFLFGYVIASEQARYTEDLAWFDLLALAGVIFAHIPLMSLLSITRHSTPPRKKSSP